MRNCPSRAARTRLYLRLLIVFVLGLPFGHAFAIDAIVLAASGSVSATRTGADGRALSRALRTSDEVNAGDLLSTGNDGRVQLRFTDGAIISIQPDSQFRIDEYHNQGNHQRAFFSLLRGALRTTSGVIGKRNPADYEMRTPTATIGIRGTEYIAEFTVCNPTCSPGPQAGLRVSVSEGMVAVFNPSGEIRVSQGQSAGASSLTSSPSLIDSRPILQPRTLNIQTLPAVAQAPGGNANVNGASANTNVDSSFGSGGTAARASAFALGDQTRVSAGGNTPSASSDGNDPSRDSIIGSDAGTTGTSAGSTGPKDGATSTFANSTRRDALTFGGDVRVGSKGGSGPGQSDISLSDRSGTGGVSTDGVSTGSSNAGSSNTSSASTNGLGINDPMSGANGTRNTEAASPNASLGSSMGAGATGSANTGPESTNLASPAATNPLISLNNSVLNALLGTNISSSNNASGVSSNSNPAQSGQGASGIVDPTIPVSNIASTRTAALTGFENPSYALRDPVNTANPAGGPAQLTRRSPATTGPSVVSAETPSGIGSTVIAPIDLQRDTAGNLLMSQAGDKGCTNPASCGENPSSGSSGSGSSGSGSSGSGSSGSGSSGSGSSGSGSSGSGSSGSGSSGSGSSGSGSSGSGSSGSGSSGSGSSGSGSSGSGSSGSGSSGSGSSGSGSSGSGSSGSGSSGSGNSGSGNSGSGSSGSGSSGSGSSGSGSSGSGTTTGPLTSGSMNTSTLSLNLRGVPLLNSLSLASAGSLTTLDPDRRLQSVGICPSVLCLSRGTAFHAEAENFADAYVSWGRWKSGAVDLRILGISTSINLSYWQGLHYLVGVPTLSMPTAGSFSYALTGATLATTSDGVVAPGTLSASALVQFASGTQTRVGLQGNIVFANTSLQFSSNGGVANPAASNLNMTSASTFSGNLNTTQTGSSLLNCAGSTCSTQVRGAFFGPDAARMGIDYSVSGSGGNRTINGVGVFTKQ